MGSPEALSQATRRPDGHSFIRQMNIVRGNDDVPDMTPEELQRRGDDAEALWRELVRRATARP